MQQVWLNYWVLEMVESDWRNTWVKATKIQHLSQPDLTKNLCTYFTYFSFSNSHTTIWTWLNDRVDSVIESLLRLKIMHWIIWAETFVRRRWMISNQFLKILMFSVNILNFKEMLFIFLILRRSCINEVRLDNLYLALCNIASNSGDNTG